MGKIEYYTTFRWMREELHLAGTELECYAVIYSLSLGDNWYMAGVKNMVQLLERSEPTIISALKNLTDKGLIVKEPVVINNIKRNYYKAKRTFDEQETTLNNLSTPTLNNLSGINKINNKEIKEKSISNDIPKKSFKKPTIEEIQAYIKEKKMHFDAERFFDYYECKGWVVGKSPMKDWKAACRLWEHSRQGEEKEEENTDEMPAGMTREKWMKIQDWMREMLPRIWKYIDVNMFLTMHSKAHFKSDVMRDILMDIDQSGYDGDLTNEFERIRNSSKYFERVQS